MNTWDIIESYFKVKDATANQIESYNLFITDNIKTIVTSQNINIAINKTQTLYVYFDNVCIDRPFVYDENRNKRELFPTEARNRDLSYETIITCDVKVIMMNNETNIVSYSQLHTKVELFKLPVMVNSCICNLKTTTSLKNEDVYNNGGYFIIKGKERVIMAQERINYNNIYVYKQKNKYKYTAEIRSVKENGDYSVLLQAKIQNDSKLVFSIPYITHDIPVAIVFLAMGVSQEFVLEHARDDVLRTLLQKSFRPYAHMSVNESILYISQFTANKVDDSKKFKYTVHIIDNEIVPHLGICSTHEIKALFILKMLTKLTDTERGIREEDDRDHICNKRIEMVGDLLSNLINALFKRSLKSAQQLVEKKNSCKSEDLNIISILKKCNINQRLYYCFSTGNWGTPKSNYIRQGVSQILCRLSYLGMLSHLNRIVVPIGKESRNTQIRQIHAPDYGFICPIESPEGQSVGIVKNFTIMARVSGNTHTVNTMDIIDLLFTDIPRTYTVRDYCIMINGVWIGSILKCDCSRFIEKFKSIRDINVISKDSSISIDDKDNEINICTDNGRILRPVLNVRNIHKLDQMTQYDWYNLIDENIVSYIDGNEAECSIIAMFPADLENTNIPYDYCEIHPCLMLGICANTIPFPDHSQAPRNVYISAMMKQAIGMYALSHNARFDTIAHVLNYPQKRLVTTKIAEYHHCEEMPSGHNIVLAIMCYTGQNQEDAIIASKSAIERGLFNTDSYKTTSTSENKKCTHESEIIQLPISKIQNPNFCYSKLDENGIVKRGTRVYKNDVLVGKVNYTNDVAVSDSSLICKTSEEGVVDTILDTFNSSGYRHIKIKIRQTRIPEIGDKVASIEAQKSTIGAIYNHEDMPFTGDGMVPDMILNPNAIPSRMTINMLLEMLSGKVGCFNGTIQDASIFDHDGEKLTDELGDELVKFGYERMGTEIMYNGFTGEPFNARIFIGPAYYQRLKHLVASKMHARGYGNVQLLSRQPCAGRAREGGLRFGEMEKDASISHGMAMFLRERLLDMSDPYQLDICPKCQTMVNSKNICMMCSNDSSIKVNIPYACKLLFQQLQAMALKINIKPV